MANLIQIKRSATNAVIPTLSPGELAFTQAGNTLFIGAPSDGSSIAIGGQRTPGTLTANQALVANSTSGINRVITANLDVNIVNVPGQGSGTAGYVLSSNGTSNVYWQSIAELSVNVDAQYVWTNSHTFQNSIFATTVNAASFTTGNISTTGGSVTNSTTIFVGNGSVNTLITSAGLNVNSSSIVNNSGLYIKTYGSATGGISVNTSVIGFGNDSVNSAITSNSSTWYFTGTSYYANNASYLNGNSAANLRTYTETKSGDAYTNAMADTLAFNRSYTGNNIFGGTNTVFNSNSVFNGGDSATFNGNNTTVTTGNLVLGSAGTSGKYTNVIFISTDLKNSGGQTVGAAIAIGGSGGGPYDIAYAPQGGLYSISGNVFFANSSLIQHGNNTSYANINGGTITFNGGGVSATINSTMYSGSVSSACNTLQLGGVAATNYITTTGNYTVGGNLYFTGSNTVFGDASTDLIRFNGTIANNFIPSANITYNLGNNTMRWASLYVGGSTIYLDTITLSDVSGVLTVGGGSNSIASNTITANSISGIAGAALNITSNTVFGSGVANIDATSSLLRVRDIDVSGNLTVSGTITSINTQTLIVNDNIIELASNNNLAVSDIIDSGWYSTANTGGTVNFPAFGRIASNSTLTNPYFKLFTQTSNPNTAATFTPTSTGTLEAYLAPYGKGGVFIANSTVVNITANSTVSSALTVNSISLSTALGGDSGGTGFKTYTAGEILVANSSNLLDKLSLGTNGKVLQSNGTALVYDILDGGSF